MSLTSCTPHTKNPYCNCKLTSNGPCSSRLPGGCGRAKSPAGVRRAGTAWRSTVSNNPGLRPGSSASFIARWGHGFMPEGRLIRWVGLFAVPGQGVSVLWGGQRAEPCTIVVKLAMPCYLVDDRTILPIENSKVEGVAVDDSICNG